MKDANKRILKVGDVVCWNDPYIMNCGSKTKKIKQRSRRYTVSAIYDTHLLIDELGTDGHILSEAEVNPWEVEKISKKQLKDEATPILYLLSYVGVYDGSEGDHTHAICTSLNAAKRKFNEWVKEAEEYYGERYGIDYLRDGFITRTDTDWRLRIEDDSVDIYITEIKTDGKQVSHIF